MKKFSIVPKKDNNGWRFRWYHVLICSVLIAAVFVSMSVGLGYARFRMVSKPASINYEVNGRQLKLPGYVIAKRVSGEDTVLVSEDGNFKVTVPKTATGAGLTDAEYLLLKINSFDVKLDQYDKEAQQNSVSYSAQLQSYPADTTGEYPFVTDDNNSITVELKIGYDAVDFENVTPNTSCDYNGENDVLSFTGINQITDTNGTFAAEFDRATITPDTSWFDDTHNVFIINTPEQLAGVAKLVNDGETDFDGITIMLGKDISLYNQDGSKYTWVPIGNDEHPFKGSFDGDGHTISGLNLRVYDDTVDEWNRTCGLFGEVSGDGTNTIENVTLIDVSYAANMGVYSGSDEGQAFGPLAGYTCGVNISNVHVDGLNVYGTVRYIGGIIGRGDSNGSISGSSVENAVFDAVGADYVGGIVGLQFGNGLDINISECYVSADMSDGYTGVGGIIGKAFETNGAVGVEKSYAIGSFEPTVENGIVGSAVSADYVINNSFSQHGDITWQTDEECWFTADMTYEEYLAALRAHDVTPTEPPTEAPAEAPTEAPTDVYATEQYETPIH